MCSASYPYNEEKATVELKNIDTRSKLNENSNRLALPDMDYTITINPENWDVFLKLKEPTFAFRATMLSELKKIKVGDRLVVYLAQSMSWTGVYKVTKEAYNDEMPLYPSEPHFTVRLPVCPIKKLSNKNYIPIKEPELWNKLKRFEHVDHKQSGWIYNAQLARSLTKILESDTEKILDYMKKFS